ncbi:MAG: adenylosuccinate lyase family protein [Alphaproteobacteria bacterium]|jgi:adenylosuccinate lyase|nr:adenylosuccinate lyase [Rhodospirillaceae bacterium]MDP6022499.1 adenylosuccinate lyase family protein [Alphaproteobacteria bacterium]MDP6255516.1 adenylosuccinate lyase family protein [Alphaproteobacteria bacterium]MDP7056531.1 adenylosuccinate lyase family protein [Alphaproteobacteria bacterium]MDP7229496.1 adenylosuccinate lyase family protein [Alphaproteobacteria bacterium]|tara:strand:- start:21827 stop:23185 length:1359 start_codon:yes stop_codon:yes gene_type:complete
MQQDNPTSLRVPDPGVADLLAQDARWQAWLDVEAALARAEAELDMIPAAAATEITRKCDLALFDRARLTEGFQRTGHSLVPLIWELSRLCDGDAGNYVHWGATTQNITQTGDLLQLRKVHRVFLRQLGAILAALADLAERSKDMALPGRTHGQHAVPATYGLKVAVWIDEFARHVERLEQCGPRVFQTMLGGAAGTAASFGAQGLEVQARLAAHLDMPPMPVPARTIMDHLAEHIMALALLAASCGKFANEIYTGMKQEFGEVEEPISAGTVGSSTMPQKRNPFTSQDIMAYAAQIRTMVPLALEAVMTEHEANRQTSLMMRQAQNQVCVLMGDTLERVRILAEGIVLKPERMRANLDLTKGLIMAEPIMLALGEFVGRQEAHDIVYDAAQAVAVGESSFSELLGADPRFNQYLSPEQMVRMLDPTRYTGLSSQIAQEQAQRARIMAKGLAD